MSQIQIWFSSSCFEEEMVDSFSLEIQVALPNTSLHSWLDLAQTKEGMCLGLFDWLDVFRKGRTYSGCLSVFGRMDTCVDRFKPRMKLSLIPK